MKSPFPGMDPFIENQKWSDFHGTLIQALRQFLLDNLPEGLEVEAESTFGASDLILGTRSGLSPDVSVAEDYRKNILREPVSSYGAATVPTMVIQLNAEEITRQRTVVIKRQDSKELVAAIEVLSPANKQQPNIEAYRRKRNTYLAAGVHLLELDLLRGGKAPFEVATWPDDPYRIQLVNAFTSECVLWSVPIFQQLPTVILPLLIGMDPVLIDLQKTFTKVYESSKYRQSLTYAIEKISPSPSESEMKLLVDVIAQAGA